MFYDVFSQLCAEKGVRPSRVAMDLGLSKTTATKWKQGAIPSGDKLQKLSEYFSVSVDYLLGNENEKTSPAAMTEDEELQYVLEQYKNRPCLRMLFKVSDKATAKHVYQAAEQIEALTLLEEHKAADEQSVD